jgi:predicted heme/steroid binding protein
VIASVADTINGVLRVHYLGVDRRIHELSISGGWRDADLSGVTGGPEVMAGSGLASVVDSVNGVFRLHYIAADAHVHELYISGGWHDGDLTGVGGGPTVAPGTAIASVADTINHVFRIHYAGKDDRVHELSISGGWRDGDLTGATGGAPVGAAIR